MLANEDQYQASMDLNRKRKYNVLHKRVAHTTEPRTSPTFATRQLLTTMAQPITTQSTYNEGDIFLTILAINKKQIQSKRRAVLTFNVPLSTLRDRRAGTQPRRDCEANYKKLTKSKELAII